MLTRLACVRCGAGTEFQRREATFKRREEMLKKKDLELQESLIRFNKFLQENDSKRNRAEKKRQDEQRQKTSKEAEVRARVALAAPHGRRVARGRGRLNPLPPVRPALTSVALRPSRNAD